MSVPRALLALPLVALLAACDASNGSGGASTGIWAGTAEFRVDTLLADQNFRVITDYETRYEFELAEDENGLILGHLNQYNTGMFTLREPRDLDGEQGVHETVIEWDGQQVKSWPVYGTFADPILELDLPQAEADDVFPKDLWTFTVVGNRARLEATKILHGYTFPVFENNESQYTVVLSPSNSADFSLRRE